MPYVRRMASQRTPLYHYRVKDKIVGPICLTDLHALLVSKKILPDTMIREEHSQCWMPLATELRRQERLARLRASAFMLSCRPPKSCLLFTSLPFSFWPAAWRIPSCSTPSFTWKCCSCLP